MAVALEADVARVDVRRDVGNLLMLRSTVPSLFRKIANLDAPRVIVDFSGVEFMSRSFADEYLAAKAACQKRIEERRLPVEVRRMLELVSNQLHSARAGTLGVRRPLRRVRVFTL